MICILIAIFLKNNICIWTMYYIIKIIEDPKFRNVPQNKAKVIFCWDTKHLIIIMTGYHINDSSCKKMLQYRKDHFVYYMIQIIRVRGFWYVKIKLIPSTCWGVCPKSVPWNGSMVDILLLTLISFNYNQGARFLIFLISSETYRYTRGQS